MPYSSPAAIVTGTTISKSTFGDVVKADLDFLANPPACRVFHSTTQALADAATTSLAFNSETYDTNAMHDTSTNNSRITFQTAGLYVIGFDVTLEDGADYSRFFGEIRTDGTTVIARSIDTGHAGSGGPHINVVVVDKFTVGRYVEARVFQDNTANVARNALSASARSPYFHATWIGLG